jgi:hypothetical protein
MPQNNVIVVNFYNPAGDAPVCVTAELDHRNLFKKRPNAPSIDSEALGYRLIMLVYGVAIHG